MARRKVMLPNWANTEEASKSVEMLNEAFEGLTQGELVINTKANNTLLTTLNENGTPVIFESSEMINKRLEGFLENIQQPDNKDVLDGIDSEKVAAWDAAQANVLENIAGVEGSIADKTFTVSGVSTDLLKQGSETLIFNCGNSQV